jgi:hypothetical protein
MLDENEFLSPYGIRFLSKYHLEHPFVFHMNWQEYKVQYLPAESNNGMFGGNSNWRGPVWMPMNALLIRALLRVFPWGQWCGSWSQPTDRMDRDDCSRARSIRSREGIRLAAGLQG